MASTPTAPIASSKKYGRRRSLVERLKAVMSVCADVAVIGGLLFGLVQILQLRDQERVRNAIEATAPLRSPEFLAAYSNVLEAHREGATIPARDLTYIANIYENVALLYQRKIADPEIVRLRVGTGPVALMPMLVEQGWPADARGNLEKFVVELARKNPPGPQP